jgi:hypothetical protein
MLGTRTSDHRMASGFYLYPDGHCIPGSVLDNGSIANLPVKQPSQYTCTSSAVATLSDNTAMRVNSIHIDRHNSIHKYSPKNFCFLLLSAALTCSDFSGHFASYLLVPAMFMMLCALHLRAMSCWLRRLLLMRLCLW